MRHARSVFVIVLVAGLFISCYALYQGMREAIGNQFATNGNITATAPAQLLAGTTAAPEPTATSTATPWPTADLRYLEAAKAEAEIAEKNANAAQSQANAQSTTVANAGIIATITKAYEYDIATQEAGTATAAPSVTAQAYQIIQRVNDETLRTQQESEKSRNESIKELIVWGVGGALVLVVGVVIAYAVQIGLHNMAQKVYDQRDQEFITSAGAGDELPTENDIAQINHSLHEAYLKEIAITREEKALIRRAAVEYGGRFSNETMTPKEKFFSDYRWRQIEDLLLDHSGPDSISYAVRLADRSVGLTSDGWDWLGLRQPPPSPTVTTPENAQKTAIQHHTTPQNTEGEGNSGGEGA